MIKNTIGEFFAELSMGQDVHSISEMMDLLLNSNCDIVLSDGDASKSTVYLVERDEKSRNESVIHTPSASIRDDAMREANNITSNKLSYEYFNKILKGTLEEDITDRDIIANFGFVINNTIAQLAAIDASTDPKQVEAEDNLKKNVVALAKYASSTPAISEMYENLLDGDYKEAFSKGQVDIIHLIASFPIVLDRIITSYDDTINGLRQNLLTTTFKFKELYNQLCAAQNKLSITEEMTDENASDKNKECVAGIKDIHHLVLTDMKNLLEEMQTVNSYGQEANLSDEEDDEPDAPIMPL